MEEEMSNLSDVSETEPLRQINPILLRSLSLKTENNLVDFIVVFIDALMETNHDCQLLINDLRSIINGTVYYFNNLDSSLTFIQANESTKIFLIISGSFGETHGHHFVELPQIECIYVFCHDRPKHKNWAHTSQKIRDVFEDKTQLLTTVYRDVKNFASRWSFLDERSFQKASTNDGRWYQLFIRVLIHQPRTENTWKEMLNEFRSFYRQNTKMLKNIDEFKTNYTADQAIKYYCEDSFIYRIINCALRTHDINIIIKFQPYISDLYDELKKKYLRQSIDFQKRKTRLPIRVVYRGQYMREAELEQLRDYCQSRNSHIVLNTFGSATRDPQVALQFIPDDCPDYVRCLYQIIIPDHHYTSAGISSIFCHQFVDIADQAANEQEILFSVGSLFRIKYIGQSTSERSLVPIVLELYADTEEFDFYWNVLSRRIKDESDEMKDELLQFVQKYTKKGNELNWVKWWQKLKRQCGIQKDHDESLVMIMYEGFNDLESIAEAIKLRKRSYMTNNPSMFQSEENSFGFLSRAMKFRKPTRIIALYELFLQSCNENINSLQYGFDNVMEAFQCVGDAYANFHFYTENALNCYREALKLAKHNSNDQTVDRLQCKITKLSSEAPVRKFDHHTEVSKKERAKTVSSSSEYETQLAKMTDYETEYDQWSILLQFHKRARGADLRLKAKLRLRFLHSYLSEREKWIDNCDLRIFLRMPLQQQQKIDSPTDIYPLLLLAVWSHLREDVNVGYYTLNLWRYEKFMLEWLSLNDIKRILTYYRCTDSTDNVSILPTLNRLIEKVKLIVIWCTLMISVSPKQGTDCFAVDVNQINFVEVGCANVPKLVFFDDRDEITKDTVRAELEMFAH